MRNKTFFVTAILLGILGIGSFCYAAQADTSSKSSGNGAISNFDEQLNWDPMEEMEKMQQKMDKMFKETMRKAAKEEKMMRGKEAVFEPSMSIKETDTNYIVNVDLPGMNKEDISVELKGHNLTISGERKSEVKTEKEKVFKEEQNFGSFYSTITLPEDVKTTEVNAEYKNGVLKITMPRIESAKRAEGTGIKIQVK